MKISAEQIIKKLDLKGKKSTLVAKHIIECAGANELDYETKIEIFSHYKKIIKNKNLKNQHKHAKSIIDFLEGKHEG